MADGAVTIFLCGDVMTGRGVDQILPHPGEPPLWESHVRDARTYVGLAEAVNGPIPRPVPPSWPWGDALAVLAAARPDARVINLETSITTSDHVAAGKPVCYRMNPANIDCLTVARPHVCVLANNHVLDFGASGLIDTLDTLTAAGITTAGAGRDVHQAQQPAIIGTRSGARVVVFSLGTPSSGTPPAWAATPHRPGVDYLGDLSETRAAPIIARIARVKRPGDVVIVSIHWGSNWGYAVTGDQVDFAHRLIDAGVDVVHGHSSHHPRPIELYRGKLILYGCGDFIDDYEGITGYDDYRDDLRLLFLATIDPATGQVAGLRMSVLQARQMRLCHAGPVDTRWLATTLTEVSAGFGTRIDMAADHELVLARR